MQAATSVARRLGIDRIDPIVLHESEHTSIRLFPLDVVARVVRIANKEGRMTLCRELAVVRHLVERAAPVVVPATALPAGPHFHEGFGLTLWQFVEHVAADSDNSEHVAVAAKALRRVHGALADFLGELPSFRVKTDNCRALLENETALSALAVVDRTFLLRVYDQLIAMLDSWQFRPVPIHGDAGAHNVFMTLHGALWNDFSAASLGPREWDIGWLPNIDLADFEPIDRELLSVLSDLRSLCVCVWCWAKYHMPEKREAAYYHPRHLQERFRSIGR